MTENRKKGLRGAAIGVLAVVGVASVTVAAGVAAATMWADPIAGVIASAFTLAVIMGAGAGWLIGEWFWE